MYFILLSSDSTLIPDELKKSVSWAELIMLRPRIYVPDFDMVTAQPVSCASIITPSLSLTEEGPWTVSPILLIVIVS